MKNPKNILLILSLIILDQATKFYFTGKNIEIFKYFSFNFVANTGMGFGLLKGFNLLFIFTTLLVILLTYYIMYKKKEKKYQLSFNLIIAGAIGNLIDRIFRGFVVDFIDIKIWPVFNLADAFVTIGVVILAWKMIKEKD